MKTEREDRNKFLLFRKRWAKDEAQNTLIRLLAKDQMKPYLSPAEFAALLGLSRRTVYNWIKAGRLPVFRPSPHGVLRIPVACVEEQTMLKEKKS